MTDGDDMKGHKSMAARRVGSLALACNVACGTDWRERFMMRHAVLFFVVLFVSCNDTVFSPSPWTFGESGSRGIEDEPDASCAEFFRVDDRTSLFGFLDPVVTNDRVFLSDYPPGEDDLDVVEWNGQQPVTVHRRAGHEWPIDGERGTLWAADWDDFLKVTLDSGEAAFEVALPAAHPAKDWLFAQPRRYSNGEHFAWADLGTLTLVVDGLGVLQYEGAERDLWVGDHGTAWVSLGDATRTVHFTDFTGRDRMISGEDYLGYPVTLGDKVVFVADGRILAWDVASGHIQSVLEGLACGPLHSDGTNAVAACRGEGPGAPQTRTGYLHMEATDVWTIDESLAAARVYRADGSQVFAPMINDRWLAWVEYDPTAVDLAPPTTGRVMAASREEGGAPAEVARVLRGCEPCERWMPPTLDLGGDTLAFGSAVRPDQSPDETGSNHAQVGVVRLGNCDFGD